MHNAEIHLILIVVGSILLLGVLTDALGRFTKLPRVSLLFVFGFLLGPEVTGLLPAVTNNWFSLIASAALILVGFSLGGKMTFSTIKRNGITVLWVSTSVVFTTVIIMTTGLLWIGAPLTLALLLAGIATATDPAATLDVIEETESGGQFTQTLEGVVSIDDAWGLVAFSTLLALVSVLGGEQNVDAYLISAVWEIFGAVLLGILLGFPMAAITSRLRPGKTMLLEVLGMTLLCGGLAQYLNVSYLLSAMVLGMVVANFAEHCEQSFYEIEEIEWPLMILFFVLTGASLNLDSISAVWPIVLAYVLLRTLARAIGCYPGAVVANAIPSVKRWLGLALLPQAGIAVGMALIAAAQFPGLADTVIQVVVVATIVFEVIGPIITRISLIKSGESAVNRYNDEMF